MLSISGATCAIFMMTGAFLHVSKRTQCIEVPIRPARTGMSLRSDALRGRARAMGAATRS